MLRVSVVLDLLPVSVRKILNLLVNLITTLSMGLLAFYSVEVVSNIKVSGELSPAMLWPMWAIYSMMLIGFCLATLRGVQQVVLQIQHFGDKELSTIEQTMKDAEEEAAMAKGGND